MASSVSSYFITTGLSNPNHSHEKEGGNTATSEEADTEDKNGKHKKKSKNKNKQMVLTRNELTRRRMDLIRSKLEESRARYFEKIKTHSLNCSRPIPRVGDAFVPVNQDTEPTQEQSTEIVSISNTGDLPYVYFVVSPDKLDKSKPKLKKEDRQKEYSARPTTRQTKKFTRKEDYGIYTDKNKMDALAKTLGITQNPIEGNERPIAHKQIVFPLPVRYTPKNPPVTPATTIMSGSIGFRGSREQLDANEFDSLYEKPVKMTIYEDVGLGTCNSFENIGKEFNEIRKNSARSISTRCLELPFISLDEQRKALGTAGSYGVKSLDFVRKSVSQSSSQKRVHFAEAVSVDMPLLKGSQIGGSYEVLPYVGERANTVPDFRSDKSKSLSDFKSLPDNRSIRSTTSTGKRSNVSLDLPKIDIVSSVYDELIVKAIQAYITTLPTYSKQAKVAQELLDQLHNRTITTADLEKDKYKSIREDIANMPRRNAHMKKQKSNLRTEDSEKKRVSPVEPKCYRMVLPGRVPHGPKLKVLQ